MPLDKKEYAERLREFYLRNYGERESDVWYEQPAVNVWVFSREGRIVTLKSHVLTGSVSEYSEYIEEKENNNVWN